MLLAAALGTAIGAALGMLGGGGSLLVLPVLVFIAGQTPHEAATSSLVIVTAGALAGGLTQARAGSVCWRHAAVFSSAALPAIVAGTAVGEQVGERVLLGAFGALMLLAAYATTVKAPGSASGKEGECPALRPGRDAVWGAVVGLLTGFLGVGGGFVVVPVLALMLGFGFRSAIGTSLAIVTAVGLLGTAVHLASGRSVDPALTLAMSAAVVGGAAGGAHAARRVSAPTLAVAFSALVTVVGVFLVGSSAWPTT